VAVPCQNLEYRFGIQPQTNMGWQSPVKILNTGLGFNPKAAKDILNPSN